MEDYMDEKISNTIFCNRHIKDSKYSKRVTKMESCCDEQRPYHILGNQGW